ncbi:MAG: hypothetical protein J1F07_10020 [Muribaculaceae bacterium]|nr:hypothetical protein [Muribaculaceae bacterium]
MKLITTDEQLRSHLPNIVQTVKGETPFIERISTFIDLAEDWVKTTFTSESTFNTICGYADNNIIKTQTARLVVADALRRAIPSLDIVLTPNGFGIVNSSNIAPASKPRVDRLVGSMLSHRDDCIAALMPELVGASKWLSSSQAEYFGSTLFPTMDIVDAIGGATGSKWDKYQELHPQLYDLEASLAEEWFSLELMTQLRSENLRGTLSAKRKSIVLSIQASIVGYLKGGSFNSRRLADIVNHIRQNADDFSEWHNSETAKLFAPPVFRNKKNAAGYFF